MAVRVTALLWTAVLAGASIARADDVYLENGDHVSGRLINLSAGTLIFRMSVGTDLNIPWGQVVLVTVDDAIRVTTRTEGPTTISGIRPDEEGRVALGDGRSVELPDIVTLVRPQRPFVFDGIANAGFLTSSGNTDQHSLHVDAEGALRHRENRYLATVSLNRSKDRGIETSENWAVTAKYDRFLTRRVFVNGNTILTNDRFRDLELRTAVGVGVGFQALDSRRMQLRADVGMGWVNEDLSVSTDDHYSAARESMQLDVFLVGPRRLQLFHKHDGFFETPGQGRLFVKTINGVRLGLLANFVATTQLELDYDNSPPAGQRGTDRTFSITFGYRF